MAAAVYRSDIPPWEFDIRTVPQGIDPLEISDWHRRHGRANRKDRNLERAAEAGIEAVCLRWGRNSGFVLTLDDALQRAFRGSEEAHHLLLLALTTIAPPRPKAWDVDEAFSDLGKLRTDMDGAGLRQTAIRLGTRWEQCRDLELALAEAQEFADRSNAMRFERMRATWHRDQTA